MVYLSRLLFCTLIDTTLMLAGATSCTSDDHMMGNACIGIDEGGSFLQMAATRGGHGKGSAGIVDQKPEPRSAGRPVDEDEEEGSVAGLYLSELLEQHTLEELHMEEALSEKHQADEFDCADEVLLRLAITESFYTPSYDECISKFMNKSWAKGSWGWGKTLADLEKKVRERCITLQGHGVALGPRLIRMTFHDAADFNNSMLPDGNTLPADKTGVDACLRTALLSVGLKNKDDDDDLKDVAKGEPNHNRGLKNAIQWVLQMSSASKLPRPDVMVLGAVTAMEAWMGMSELGVKFGRLKGDCQKINCNKEECWDSTTPFFKQPVAEPVGSGMFCPMTNTLEPLRQVMGLTMEELVALQGAHSVGGVIVCSGLGNVANAPYCPKKCGLPPGNFWETGNLDGTSFDDTPGKMDNRYYQLLMGEDYEDLPACDEVNSKFPRLNKRGLQRSAKSDTCAAGVKYDSENGCEVEACVQKCSATETCLMADNLANYDREEFKVAWASCLTCKKLCSGSHSRKVARLKFLEELNSCKGKCTISDECNKTVNVDWTWRSCAGACKATRDTCKNTAAGSPNWKWKSCVQPCRKDFQSGKKACKLFKGRAKRMARKQCFNQLRSAKKSCIAACRTKGEAIQTCHKSYRNCIKGVNGCRDMSKLERKCKRCPRDVCKPQAEALKNSIYNTKDQKKRPVGWCKRLSSTKKCLDAKVKMPINGGWGKCPKDKQISLPNTGAGRLTIIQNLDRWTKFRGLFKRVMVLPSDWSYLGKNETKDLFKRFGTDEGHWKNMFTQAWSKVSELGWNGKLKQCRSVPCTVKECRAMSQEKNETLAVSISCPVQRTGIGNAQNKRATARMQRGRRALGLPDFVRPENLEFEGATCNPPVTTKSCELIGAFGVKAKLICGGITHYCTTNAAMEIEKRIETEWKSGGGQEPSCSAEVSAAPTMLETDAVVTPSL